MGTSTYVYGHNDVGNRLFADFNGVTNSYTANCLNQYTGISGGHTAAPTYDMDGNMMTFGEWAYSWDGENRMASAVPVNPTNGSIRVEYGYDHRHRRVSTRVRVLAGQEPFNPPSPPGDPGEWFTVRTHSYVFDDWNLIAETVADTNGVISRIEYVWGLDISGSLQGAGGVGGLIAVSVDGEIYLPCYDANGNITAYVDDQGGVVARYGYDAFGKTISVSGALAGTFTFRFSTKYHDAETGLYYYGCRFYSSEQGRWLNRDPIGKNGGLNLYAITGNDAINFVDFVGLTKVSITMQTRYLPDPATETPKEFISVYATIVEPPPKGCVVNFLQIKKPAGGTWSVDNKKYTEPYYYNSAELKLNTTQNANGQSVIVFNDAPGGALSGPVSFYLLAVEMCRNCRQEGTFKTLTCYDKVKILDTRFWVFDDQAAPHYSFSNNSGLVSASDSSAGRLSQNDLSTVLKNLMEGGSWHIPFLCSTKVTIGF